MLDSLNDTAISAENDQYRGAFAHFACFTMIWRGEGQKNDDVFNFTEWSIPRFHPIDAACEVLKFASKFQEVAASQSTILATSASSMARHRP
jgi:hypothetical protein